MSILAVSDFLHSVFIILVATPFILLWGCATAARPVGGPGLGPY